MLDDDRAGRRSASSYREQWFLSESQVFTLRELSSEFKDYRLEDFITEDTREIIKSRAGLASLPNKKQIGLYLAEMCSTDSAPDSLSKSTLSEFDKLIKALARRFPKVA